MRSRCLLTTAMLLAQVAAQEASLYCGRLEYWNPDSRCCGSCLQRFGPPPCPEYEFSENCGLNDFGDHVKHPFRQCPPGQCNPDGAELCSPCGDPVTASTPAGSSGTTRSRCREKPVPTKEPCILITSSLSWTSQPAGQHSTSPSFVLPLVGALLGAAAILLLVLQRHRCCYCRRHPCPCLVWGDSNTHTPLSLGQPTSRSLVAAEAGDSQPEISVPPLLRELPSLAAQPLSRLLDELEVLEELIVLLDPEPGPGGGGMACGTTRHLAARYGLPAAWSTFAYSLRPSRSPLRALVEMVVAREPSASVGQLSTHLAELGRADALQVLSKLGSSRACLA